AGAAQPYPHVGAVQPVAFQVAAHVRAGGQGGAQPGKHRRPDERRLDRVVEVADDVELGHCGLQQVSMMSSVTGSPSPAAPGTGSASTMAGSSGYRAR